MGYYTVNGKKVSGKSFVMPSDNVVISYKKSSGNNSTNQTIKVSKIFLSGISKQIAVGKKIKLTASVSPKNAVNKSVSWKSSNTKVATVSSSGWVTIKKKTGGKSVTITATAKDGSKKKATYVIKSMKGVVKKVSISGIKW
ncbi:MAG: Ig-like domain-containing protein [Anaerostipes sp.]|nr:Ig-like domain-containing protein [Anaerostipes sp.]